MNIESKPLFRAIISALLIVIFAMVFVTTLTSPYFQFVLLRRK